MINPKVSVIIPTYKGAEFLEETIQSVFRQTYPNFELIIVNDASPDNTTEIVNRFANDRLRYIVFDKNKGSENARYAGLEASQGEIITFLDQDDLYHPQKLAVHVELMTARPDVGLTYNPHYNLNHSSTTIRDLWRPPVSVTLKDLVMGFPLAPSDVVLKREWALKMDLLKGSLSWTGGEIVHYGGFYLDGCKFASSERALNYRRYHTGRVIKDLVGGCKSEIYAQDKILSDPRCPDDILALKDEAHAAMYLIWSFRALLQGQTAIGQEFLREAVRLKKSILAGSTCELVEAFLMDSIADESLNHEKILSQVFSQLPPEMGQILSQCGLSVARGYLIKGMKAIVWDHPADAGRNFEKAAELKAQLDSYLINQFTQNLLSYRKEFGEAAVQNKIDALTPFIIRIGGQDNLRRLLGFYAITAAFQSYNNREYRQVPRLALSAVTNNPKNLSNPGIFSIFIRSFFYQLVN